MMKIEFQQNYNDTVHEGVCYKLDRFFALTSHLLLLV